MSATTPVPRNARDAVSPPSKVHRSPAAPPDEAVAHFLGRLTYEVDVSDVHADLAAGVADFVLVDTRSEDAWAQGHVPGSVWLPTDAIPERATSMIPQAALVLTYCWGPGCNGATRAALAFARLGYRVKEVLGGYEYWVREGFAVERADGLHEPVADPLTTAVAAADCGC